MLNHRLRTDRGTAANRRRHGRSTRVAAMAVAGLVAFAVPYTSRITTAAAAGDASNCGAHGVFSTNDGLDSCTYSPTNSSDTFTTPSGVTSLNFDLYGAGGEGTMMHDETVYCGGAGGHSWGVLPTLTPGEVFQVNVGGQGQCDWSGGWNGGGDGAHKSTTSDNGAGGSGATDVRVGGFGMSDRILVAGGGGGDGGPPVVNFLGAGGSAGGLSGQDGENGHITEGGAGGGGGTQTGAGATPGSGDSAGFGFGGGGGDFLAVGGGGGGGGGWYGGGGGQGGNGSGGGGGGSSYVSPQFTNQGTSTADYYSTGNVASATISWDDPIPVSMTLSPTTAAAGSIQLQASVSPSTATGAVDFTLGSTDLGVATVNGGVAELTTSSLPTGADAVNMNYSGDAQHLANTQQSTVDVGIAPQITTNPTSVTTTADQIVQFSASASGTPTPTVQWIASTDNGNTWVPLSGATSTTLYVTGGTPQASFVYNLPNGSIVYAIFTNLLGSARTLLAQFTDAGKPVITQTPANTTLFPGNNLVARAQAVASPAATVQWQVSTDKGMSWSNIPGATSDEYDALNVSLSMNGWEYQAVFTNSYGSATTNAMTLTVSNPAACIVDNPTSTYYSRCVGVDLQGMDLHNIDLNFADLRGADLADTNLQGATFVGANLSGAALNGDGTLANSYEGLALSGTDFSYANLTGAYLAGDDFSQSNLMNANVSDTLILPPNAYVEPTSSAGAAVSWTAPSMPGTTLQSCTATSGSTFAPGTTTVTCTVALSMDIEQCYPGPVACTTTGTFSVYVATPLGPTGINEPQSTSVAPGGTATFTSGAEGNPTPTIQWQISTDEGQNWTDIADATSNQYSFTAQQGDSGNQYRAEFANFMGTVDSDPATLTVQYPGLDVAPDPQTMSYGAAPPTFTAQYFGFLGTDSPANSLSGSLQCDTTPSVYSATPLTPGTYPITCTGLTSTNYQVEFDSGLLTVTPAPLTVTANPQTYTYGNPPPPVAASVGGLVGSDTFANLGGTCASPATSTSPAGIYLGAIRCGGITSPNYTVTYVPGDLTVLLAPLTVAANPKSMSFGGAVPPFDATVYGLVGSDTFAGIGGSCADPAASSKLAVDTYPGAITCSGVTDPNYAVQYQSAPLTVMAAPLVVVANPKSMTYGGTVPTFDATITGLIGTDTFAGLGGTCGDSNASSSLAAGTYTGAISCGGVTSNNYGVLYAPATFTVNQATASCTVTGYSVTFDGNAHTASGSCTGVGGATLSGLSVAGTAHTAAGSYGTDPWTFTDTTGNYRSASGSVADTISTATPSCTVTGYSVTFDGNSHTASGSCSGVGGATLSGLSVTGTAHTAAGSYDTDPWRFTDTTGNYQNTTGTVTDAIGKASATCSITGYSVKYDTMAHTATGACTGVDGTTPLAGLNLTGTTHTAAGSYTADPWSFTDTSGNYENNSGTVTDAISKIAATCTITGYAVIYDGSAHTAAGSCVGAGGSTLPGLVITGTHTAAGTYTDRWTFTDSTGNYQNASGTFSDSISKAAPSCTVTPYSVSFNGAAHTATGSCVGVDGTTALAGLVLSGTSHTAPGTYGSDAWTFTDTTGNYQNASGTVADTITKATPACTVTGYSVTFDANSHTATGSCTGLSGTTLSGLSLTGTTHTVAGSHPTDPWMFTDTTGDYQNASGTVSDTIAKAAPTCKVTGYSVVFDGNAHTATGSCTGVGGAALAGLSPTGTTHTAGGSYPADPWTFTDTTGNYQNSNGTVTDTIGQASTSLLYGGTQIVVLGTTANTVVSSAQLSSGVAACLANQTVHFAVTPNPLTGTGSLTLPSGLTASGGAATAAVAATTGWAEGVYTVNANFAGTPSCSGSSDEATLTVASAGDSANGGGWYTLSGSGRINFGFTVQSVPHTSPTQYKGQLVLINNGVWQLNGSFAGTTAYAKTGSGQAAISGTGTLSWWNPALNSGFGGWQVAQTGVAFTASLDQGNNAKSITCNGTNGQACFGIHITYTPIGSQPSKLPNSVPQPMKGGQIKLN